MSRMTPQRSLFLWTSGALLRLSLAACFIAGSLFVGSLGSVALAGDWPHWGHDGSRNMVAAEKGLPHELGPGTMDPATGALDVSAAAGVKWVAKLGSQTYGNPTVAGGQIFVGTNNGSPRDAKFEGDYSMVMAFEEKSGKFKWQLATPKLGAGKVSDWEFLGICSSPAVEGKRVYVVTNRGDVVALDTKGLSNGNERPFADEATYMQGARKPAVKPGKKIDGDIVWRYAMREDLGVFPHNITSSSVLVHDGRVYVSTSNGVDWSHKNIPAPHAPALVVLDARTGKLIGEEVSGISQRVMHANWSSPSLATLKDGSHVVLFGAGDGWLYGFDPVPALDAEGVSVLKELFRFDANPKHYRVDEDGKPRRYVRRKGPSEIIATPVFANGLVYVAIGQDPEHGSGLGALSAVDPHHRGDITESGRAWRFEGIGRSISTVAVADGIAYAADLSGRLYALDAAKGDLLWKHDTRGHIWGSPLVADGKVYLGNEDGTLMVFKAGRTLEVLHKAQFHSPIYGSAIAANKTLYVATHEHLYAFKKGAKGAKAVR